MSALTMNPIIEVRGLSKSFYAHQGIRSLRQLDPKKKIHVLRQLDFNVSQGEVAALLGPNGSGKTTLIKILCSLILPDDGTIRIAGMDLARDAEKIRAMLGLVVAEERSFYWRLTGRENLEFFASLNNLKRSLIRERIEQARELFELHALDKRFQEYSKGMMQRLALARCYLIGARILFLDEPTRSLDPEAAAKLRHFIRQFAKQENSGTILFATHQLAEAEEAADTLMVMREGTIAASGPAETIKRPNETLADAYMRLTQGEGA